MKRESTSYSALRVASVGALTILSIFTDVLILKIFKKLSLLIFADVGLIRGVLGAVLIEIVEGVMKVVGEVMVNGEVAVTVVEILVLVIVVGVLVVEVSVDVVLVEVVLMLTVVGGAALKLPMFLKRWWQ